MENEFLNRRTAQRFDVDLACRIESGEDAWEGRIENLSLTGAEVQCPSADLEPGARVQLVLKNGSDELGFSAQVLREASDRGAVGLRFIGDPRETAEKLSPVIRRASRSKQK